MNIKITDSKDLLANQIIFLFVGNEKIYGKDFDLDPLGINYGIISIKNCK